MDPLFAASQIWECVTPYRVTRHAHGVAPEDALAMDRRTECRRHGLPAPRVRTLECQGVAAVGLQGRVQLEFDAAVQGPLVLGRSRCKGSGLFLSTRFPEALNTNG